MNEAVAPVAPSPTSLRWLHIGDWRPHTAAGWLLLNAAAALAMWLAGALGAQLSLGGASALWPPNGVALAFVMLWGGGVLPGLVLGAMAQALWLALQQDMGLVQGYGLPLAMRLASALQWFVASLALGPWRQAIERTGWGFGLRFVVIVPLCCLIAATAGPTLRWLLGTLDTADLASNMLNWWVGDVAGMLIVTPLLLALLHGGMRRHLLANLTFPSLALGLGLSLAGSALIGHVERLQARERASAELREFAQSLRNQMALAEADLGQLAALYYRARPDAADFDHHATALRLAHDWVSGFALLRALPHTQRPGFEERLQQNLRSLGPDGAMRRAPEQTSYWAVELLNPGAGQETRLGVDEGADPLRRPAIEQAVRERRLAATRILDDLLYASGTEWGVLLYQPVFERLEDGAPSPQPTGLVSASVQLAPLLQAALRGTDGLQFPLLISAQGEAKRALSVQGQTVRELDAAAAATWQQGVPRRDRSQQSLRLGQAEWRLVNDARGQAGLRFSAWQAGTLALGLSITALLSALLAARGRRDEVLQRWSETLSEQVSTRTAELDASNRQLQNEAQERERVHRALAERQAMLDGLLQAIPDPMWMRAPDGRLLVVNEAFEQFTGRSADTLLGRVADGLPPTEPAALARIEDRMALEQAGVQRSEAHWRHADQRRLLMAQMRVPVRGGPEGLQGVLGLAWDITEQRQREQALRRFRWLADSAAQGFVLCTPRGRVVYTNATVERWLQLPDDGDSRARHVRRHLDDDGWRLVRDTLMPRLLAGDGWSGMLPLIDREGRRHEELLAGATALLDPMGRARYFGLVLTDISERLALEAELAQARDRAEDANRAKSVFLSNISHEIRTPLNAVLGYAQLLAEDVQLHERARQQVQNIWRAGQRLLRLISEVLDLSKIEAGALQFSPEPVELHAELGEIVQLLQARAAEQRVVLVLDRHFAAPLTALLDRGKFGQVLLNLLANALKFSPPGAQVRLEAELSDDTLDMRVIDQGPGIGADELAQLFQPFRQGSEGARRGGTGLGLVLSRKLCEGMGGALWLESKPGQGTSACLRLPLRRSQEISAPSSDRFDSGRWRLRAGSTCRVLVAEDDLDSRLFLCSFLEGLGCQVVATADGREALCQAQMQEFDIVLSDMRMPELDGPGLREALAAQPRSASWPVVAVTASSLLDNREHFLAMGFAEYISKPYRFSDVLRALARLAGAAFEPADAAASASPSPAPSPAPAPADRAALEQALQWAREGRARDLRTFLTQANAFSPALREGLEGALARYDLASAERLLQEFLESP